MTLASWAALASLITAMAFWWAGMMDVLHGVPLVLFGLLMGLLAGLTRGRMVSRRRGRFFRVLLLVLSATQALLWSDLLLPVMLLGERFMELAVVSVLVLSLSVLLHKFSVFLLALLLCAGNLFWGLPDHVDAWRLLGVLSVALVMGLVGWNFLLQKRRVERREYELIHSLAQARAEARDQQAGLRARMGPDIDRKNLPVGMPTDSVAQTKNDFLAMISHEIRTPLNGILPILEILLESPLNEEQRRYVRTAFSSSRHLLRLINDVLDFARAESGKLQLENIEFDFRELVSSVCDLMQRSAINKGLTLECDISDDVPRKLRGDPIRLRQILTNLVSNAVKFTEVGHVRVSVSRRRARRREVELLFSVKDSGIGMSRETSRRVFSSFTQADASTTRKHGGTGLGLVICERLVTLMGGRIGVRSRPGEGSEFWFVLPMRHSLDVVPPARRDLVGIKVMGVFCDAGGKDWVDHALSPWGVTLDTATHEEVLDRLHTAAMLGRRHAFDLLLLESAALGRLLTAVLTELRSDPLLKDLPVVVASESQSLLAGLQSDYGACSLPGGLSIAPLKRCLERLLDVQQVHADGEADDSGSGLNDLNLVPEDALLETDAPLYPSPPKTGRVFKVLLVEDNPVNLGVVSRVLDRLGAVVLVAQNGREALEQLSAGGVDLVLMDCRMPVMDGYQATRHWREREVSEGRSRLPVVAMTANAMSGDRERCLEAGMDDYLAKPVSVSDIRGVLERWLHPGREPAPDGTGAPVDPVAADSAQLIDRQVLSELRELLDEEFEQLVATFLANSPAHLEQIQKAAGQRDLAALVNPAHSLKSSSANLGASSLASLARSIEQAAREGSSEAALLGCEAISDVHAATCAVLVEEIEGQA